jgi:hypothetical protein
MKILLIVTVMNLYWWLTKKTFIRRNSRDYIRTANSKNQFHLDVLDFWIWYWTINPCSWTFFSHGTSWSQSENLSILSVALTCYHVLYIDKTFLFWTDFIYSMDRNYTKEALKTFFQVFWKYVWWVYKTYLICPLMRIDVPLFQNCCYKSSWICN